MAKNSIPSEVLQLCLLGSGLNFHTIGSPATRDKGLFKHREGGFLTFTLYFRLMMNLPGSASSLFKKQLPNSAALMITTSSIPLECQGCYTGASVVPSI